MERLHRQTKTERERERERKATEFRLHANSSNLLSNSSLSLCLFRSLSLCFFIDLSNFYSNQTKPQKTKKFPNPRKQTTKKYIFLLILVLHSLQPITKKAHTHHNFLFFILINNNNINIKKNSYI